MKIIAKLQCPAVILVALMTSAIAQEKAGSPADVNLPAPAAEKRDPNMVEVPNLVAFKDNIGEMMAAARNAGLVPIFDGGKPWIPPSKDKENQFAGQMPLPGQRVHPGAVITLYRYGKYEPDAGTVPAVAGMSLDAAQQALGGAGLSVGGITEGGKPSSPELANKVKDTVPAAGEKIPDNKVVTVVQWGAYKESGAQPNDELPSPGGTSRELLGSWRGTSKVIGGVRTSNFGGMGAATASPQFNIVRKGGRILSNLPKLAWQDFTTPVSDMDQVVDGNRITYEKKGKDSDGDEWSIRIVLQADRGKLVGIRTDSIYSRDAHAVLAWRDSVKFRYDLERVEGAPVVDE